MANPIPRNPTPLRRRSALTAPVSAARRDLAWILAIALPLFVVMAKLDVFERYRAFVQGHGLSAWQADDVIFLVVFLSLALGVFALRRWRELKREVLARRIAEGHKDHFLAVVSHELRTPMTTIREGVSQIQDGLLGDTTPAQQDYLRFVLEDVDRLSRLINDLLSMSRIEGGGLELRQKHVDMAEIMRQVQGSFLPEAEVLGVKLSVVADPAVLEIYADPDQLAQVWTNLVGNALKFTPKGQVTLEAREEGSVLHCSVRDTGMGIPAEELPHLFSKFYQVKREDGPGAKGTGLGLSIAKALVEAHGGTMGVESTPGEGSRFLFELPKSPK